MNLFEQAATLYLCISDYLRSDEGLDLRRGLAVFAMLTLIVLIGLGIQ